VSSSFLETHAGRTVRAACVVVMGTQYMYVEGRVLITIAGYELTELVRMQSRAGDSGQAFPYFLPSRGKRYI